MNITSLLADLQESGIELWFEGERLRFRAPKGALTDDLRARLSESRAAVVEHLRSSAADLDRIHPLSSSQRALWFLHQRAPLSAAYNVAFSVRIVSTLDDAAVKQAVQALVDRHASLRTTFPIVGGQPVQRVAGVGAAELCVSDVPGIDQDELHDRVTADYKRSFDLEHGPLLRASIYRRAPDDHVLLLVIHHIAVDGWSLFQLVDEFQALYEEAIGGQSAQLARPGLQYSDFVTHEAAALAGPAAEPLATYWQRQLAEPRAWIELPPDRPRQSRGPTPGAATWAFELDSNLSSRLRQLARQEGVTLFVLLLAAWKTLLFRYTGTEDVIVGTPTFGRNRPEFARVVGNFVNSIPLRSHLSGEFSFHSVLREVNQTVLDGLGAQDYPLGLMVERLHATRDSMRAPLFGNLFVMQRFDQLRALEPILIPGHSGPPVTLGALRLANYPLNQQEGQFDLTLQVVDTSGALAGQLKYDTDLYDTQTISRLSQHFSVLLDAIATDPSRTLAEFPLLSAGERAELIDLAGTAQKALPSTKLHARFEAQVQRQPDAIAVVCDDERLTYAQLNQRANRLAHRLRSLGIGPETIVGLCTERDNDMVVALLAILKADAAYLPIDSSYPAERIAFMIADAAARVVVTQSILRDKLPAEAGNLVFVDDDHTDWPDADLDAGADSESLAYVIYTSGSTGTPKGTMMSHSAVGRLFDATQEWYHFDSADRWTLFHSIAFDFSVWEIWGALLHGGTLVVVPYLVSRSPDSFLELIVRERITVLNQTPSAFRQLIGSDHARTTPRAMPLRVVIFGGEALEVQSLRPWFDRYGDIKPQLVNMYGITETCVHVTYRPITVRDLEGRAGSMIGEPIPDLRVHVLDDHREPAPFGVTGELYVGGPGLARGYLGRPQLTESRFVPDPFQPGERLYRTGDLARRLASGDLEYLGRRDQQVKVRGHRIELGEIETVLSSHPSVKECVVVVREDRPGDQRIIGYVVPMDGASFDTESAKTALRARLPEYMVPSQFHELAVLPLTSNGKIDRKALPAPTVVSQSMAEFGVATVMTPTQRRVASIWRDILGVDHVGLYDNFFDIGGHSLLLVELHDRLKREFAVKLEMVELFQWTTVAAQATRLTTVAAPSDALRRAAARAAKQIDG